MSVHLITGYAGKEHITSADQGSFNAAVMGGGEFVMERGEQFRCQVISNNQVRIYDGDALMQGRHIIIDRNTYVETTHDNGTQGYKRIDLIVLTYEKNPVTSVESVKLEVIKGTPSESNPAVPAHTTGDVLNSGEAKNQMPLYKIPFDGLSIGEPVKLFSTVPTLETMKDEVDEKVDDKIQELDESFSELEAGIDGKIAEAGKPLVSNVEDMKLLKNYGEYSADAKTVGEIAKSFQDGCNTIVSGVTAQGVTPKSNSPADIVTAVNTVATNKYNAGVTAAKVGTATATHVLTGKTFTNSSGVGLSGSMANKSGTAAISATASLDSSNKRVKMAIPANGYHSTSNYLYTAYSSMASLIGLTANKIAKGNTILGVAGTYSPQLKTATIPNGTYTSKVISTSGKAHLIILAISSSESVYNLFAFYSDGEYGDAFNVNRNSAIGGQGTWITNVTSTGFTLNFGVSTTVQGAICYYME